MSSSHSRTIPPSPAELEREVDALLASLVLTIHFLEESRLGLTTRQELNLVETCVQAYRLRRCPAPGIRLVPTGLLYSAEGLSGPGGTAA